jgi:hypothetical protein
MPLNISTPLQGIKKEEALEYAQDLIDGESTMFRQTLFILCIGYGVLFLLGVIWHFTCRTRRSTSMKKGKYSLSRFRFHLGLCVSVCMSVITQNKNQMY